MVNSRNFGRIIPAMKSWPRLWILFAQIKQFFKIPQRRPRSMCGCSFFKVIDRLNHLMNISSSVGHLAGWTSQKWQPFRCPQKPAEKPRISDIWMCDMVEECMMPHNRSGSCDYDYVRLCLTSCMKGQEIFAMSANVRVRPSLCESAQKTLIAIQRWAPSSSIHEKDTILHHADAESSTTKSSCKFYLTKKIQNTHQLESLMWFVHNRRISTLKKWIHSINAHSNQTSNPPKVFER